MTAGPVRTRLGRDTEAMWLGEHLVWPLVGRLLDSPDEGARTSVWAVCSPDLTDVSGAYLARESIATPSETGRNDELAARLWESSHRLVTTGT